MTPAERPHVLNLHRLLPRVHHAAANAERDVIGALVRGTLQLSDVVREDAPSLFAFLSHAALFDIVSDLLDLSGTRRGLSLRLVMAVAERLPDTRLLAGVVLSDGKHERSVGYLPTLVRESPKTRNKALEALALARAVASERLDKEARRERSREALALYTASAARWLLATEDDADTAAVAEPIEMVRAKRGEGRPSGGVDLHHAIPRVPASEAIPAALTTRATRVQDSRQPHSMLSSKRPATLQASTGPWRVGGATR